MSRAVSPVLSEVFMSRSPLLRRALAPDSSRLRHPADREPAVLPDAALVVIAEGLAASVTADDRPVAPAGGRAFRRLLSTPSYEAWLIVWSPGAVLELHDHGGATAAVHLVDGALAEGLVDRANGAMRPRQLVAGCTVTIPAHQAHEVCNAGLIEAASVHVYSPPLEAMTFFDPPAGGTLEATRTERYDSVLSDAAP